jgi:hypothetical protein
VAHAEARLKEAQKLGFASACLPRRVARGNRQPAAPEGLGLVEIGHLGDLVARFLGPGKPRPAQDNAARSPQEPPARSPQEPPARSPQEPPARSPRDADKLSA